MASGDIMNASSKMAGLYIRANFGFIDEEKVKKCNAIANSLTGATDAMLELNKNAKTQFAQDIYDIASSDLENFINSNHTFNNVTGNLHNAYGLFLIIDGKKSRKYKWSPEEITGSGAYAGLKTKKLSLNYSKYREKGRKSELVRSSSDVGLKRVYRDKIRTRPTVIRNPDTGERISSKRYVASFRKTSSTSDLRNTMYMNRTHSVNGRSSFNAFFRDYALGSDGKDAKGITLIVANPIYYSYYLEKPGKYNKPSTERDVLHGFLRIVSSLLRSITGMAGVRAEFHYVRPQYNRISLSMKRKNGTKAYFRGVPMTLRSMGYKPVYKKGSVYRTVQQRKMK